MKLWDVARNFALSVLAKSGVIIRSFCLLNTLFKHLDGIRNACPLQIKSSYLLLVGIFHEYIYLSVKDSDGSMQPGCNCENLHYLIS